MIDDAGAPVELATRAFRTIEAPAVVRFRPRAFGQDIERTAAISVRFTMPMDRASTKAAFSVTVGGKAVKGTISFAEDDTVLVFRPAATLAWDTRVDVAVSTKARSAQGVPLGRASDAAFRTEAEAGPAGRRRPPRPSGGERWQQRRQRRRLRRLGQLDGRRALLPGPHELHPDRRHRQLERLVHQPGRP